MMLLHQHQENDGMGAEYSGLCETPSAGASRFPDLTTQLSTWFSLAALNNIISTIKHLI
jgi:hypothetical protein